MWLFGQLVLVGIALLVIVAVRASGGGIIQGAGVAASGRSRAREALVERYARGGRSTEEYRERLRTLEERGASPAPQAESFAAVFMTIGAGSCAYVATRYPASSMAVRMSASSSGWVTVTVTAPVGRSTATSVTPSISLISSVTEEAQCPQVMPVTV